LEIINPMRVYFDSRKEEETMTNRKVVSFFAGVLVLVLMVTFGAVFCPAEGKEFSKTLKFAEPIPPKSFMGKMHIWWAQEVEKRTNGRIKIQFFWMESLVKWKDMLQGVGSGIADLGTPAATYHPSDFPLLMVIDNMPYNTTDYWASVMAVIDTVRNDPDLVAEFKKANIKYVAPYCSGEFQFLCRKPFKQLSDVKGKTFRTHGGARVKFQQLLGINPIFMSFPEIYEALDRGTIFGYMAPIQLAHAYKHYEVAKYMVPTGSGAVIGSAHIGMNMKTWNKLPKDIQGIFMKLTTDFAAHWAEELNQIESKFREEWISKHGVTFGKLTPEDDRFARKCGAQAVEEFLAKQESEGYPARKVWNHFLTAREKYENEIKTRGYPWER
jgi:TRAP-type C4-dicarboxylate transport system substrate-binding protein